VNNLRQLTTAAIMYQNDSGESAGAIAYGAVESLWMETLIANYANVSRIRLCPATDDTPTPGTISAGDVATAWSWVNGSTNYCYAMNAWLYTLEGNQYFLSDLDKYFLKDSAIKYPSTTPFFMDAIWPDLWVFTNSPPARNLFTGLKDSGQISRCTIARHLSNAPKAAPRSVPPGKPLVGGIGMSFADSHVEMVKLEKLWEKTWHKGYEPQTVRPP